MSSIHQVLIIANDMELVCDFPPVANVIYVELPRSFGEYENILNRVKCGDSQKVV